MKRRKTIGEKKVKMKNNALVFCLFFEFEENVACHFGKCVVHLPNVRLIELLVNSITCFIQVVAVVDQSLFKKKNKCRYLNES